ncbi:energy-coupling factor transporter transmembrane component T [Neobacillus sp. Marseille-QA0830]
MRNEFKRFHPLVLFSYYVGALALVIIMQHPIFLCLAFLVILAVNYVEDQLKGVSKWVTFMITTGLFILILNPVFNERGQHVLFTVFSHRVTGESALYGGINALLLIGVMALFVSYNEVMAPNKLLYLFSKFLPQFAVLLMLTLRFIPLMRRRVEEISAIQTSKGMSVAHGRWRDKAKTGMLYLQLLLVHSLEEAIQTADSMKARGYGQGSRSTYEYFILKKSDVMALVYLLFLCSVVIYGRISGFGYLTIYPILETLTISATESIILVVYLLFISFPLFVQMGGYIRWRLSK